MKRSDIGIVVIIEAIYLALATRFWFVCDDAFITFRFSKNWANGHGIRYNLIEDPPVEGYSNFLWMVLATIVELAGADVRFWVPLASLALGVGFVAYLYRTVRVHLSAGPVTASLATLLFVLSPSVAVWTTSGLATLPMALFCFALFERLVLARRLPRAWIGAAVAGICLSMIRTEGVAWAVVIFTLATLVEVSDPAHTGARERLRSLWPTIGRAAAIISVVFGCYFAWRTTYFGEWVANTAHVKAHFSASSVERGGMYLALFYSTYVAPGLFLLAGAIAMRLRPRVGTAAWLMALAFPTYAVVVGGDYMTSGRLVVPSFAFLSLCLGMLLSERGFELPKRALTVGVIIIGLLPAFNVHVVPLEVRERFHVRQNVKRFLSEAEHWAKMKENAEQWRLTGLALRQISAPTDEITLAAIGAHGYYSELHILDRNGLVNKAVAKRPMNDRRVWRKSPGHDKSVRPTWFLRTHTPKYISMELITGPRTALKMRARVEEWKRMPWWAKTRDQYAPVWHQVDLPDVEGPAYLLTLSRVPDGTRGQKVWGNFNSTLRGIL